MLDIEARYSRTWKGVSVFLFALFMMTFLVFAGGQNAVAFAEEETAIIGNTYFPTLQAAVDAAEDGDEIILLRDISENVVVGEPDDDRTLIIDLGTHTIRPADPKKMVLYVNGGESITVKNGKVTGYNPSNNSDDMLDHNYGAIYILSNSAVIQNIEFNNNKGTALASHYAVITDDNLHFQEHKIHVDSCKFYYNGSQDGDFTYSAVNINGFSDTKLSECDFYGNHVGLRLASQNPDEQSNVMVKYSIRKCNIRNSISQAMDIGVPNSGTLQMHATNVYNNAVDGSRDSIINIHCVDSVGENGGNALIDYCRIYNNSGAKYTVRSDVPNIVYLRGTGIYDNTAETAGGFCAEPGTRLYIQYGGVIKNNTSTGSDESSSGGVVLKHANTVTYDGPTEDGGGATFGSKAAELQLREGAIYGNKATGSKYPENDLYVAKGCYAYAMEPGEESFRDYYDKDRSFKGYKWLELSNENYEDSLTGPVNFERWYTISKESMTFVYIDGNSGDDAGDGTKDSPVKTIKRALELADENETDYIIVLDAITLDGKSEKNIDAGGKVFRRDPGYTDGPLIKVKEGTEAVIKNVVIDGASRVLVPEERVIIDQYGNEVGTEMVQRRVHAKDSLVKVERGASLILGDGAVLQNNGIDKVQVARDTLVNPLGGGVFVEGKLTMKNGATIKDNAAKTGGGIYVSGGEFIMEGGVIEGNAAKAAKQRYDIEDEVFKARGYDPNDLDGIPEDILKDILTAASKKYISTLSVPYGGGVCLVNDGKMIMKGGIVRNNLSDSGGAGISLGTGKSETVQGGKTDFKMSGGTISNNTTESAGGGLYVQCNTTATITAGNIINNIASATEGVSFHAGGGIYVNGFHNGKGGKGLARVLTSAAIMEGENVPNGTLYLVNVELAQNSAFGEGGAIAWCGSGSGAVFMTSGTAIHDNSADGKAILSDYDNNLIKAYDGKGVDILLDDLAAIFNAKEKTFEYNMLKNRAEPTAITMNMLNGAEYKWTDEKGNRISPSELESCTTLMKLKTNAKATDPDMKESIKKATVHINGNISKINGGGIGANGNVYIGQMDGVKAKEGSPESGVRGAEQLPKFAENAEVDDIDNEGGRSRTGDDYTYLWLFVIMFVSGATAYILIRRRNIRSTR